MGFRYFRPIMKLKLIVNSNTSLRTFSSIRKEREKKERCCLSHSHRESTNSSPKMTKKPNLRSKDSSLGDDAEKLYEKKILDLESVNEALKVSPHFSF